MNSPHILGRLGGPEGGPLGGPEGGPLGGPEGGRRRGAAGRAGGGRSEGRRVGRWEGRKVDRGGAARRAEGGPLGGPPGGPEGGPLGGPEGGRWEDRGAAGRTAREDHWVDQKADRLRGGSCGGCRQSRGSGRRFNRREGLCLGSTDSLSRWRGGGWGER